MQGAYRSKVPSRQRRGGTTEGSFFLNEAQDRILYQLLGIGAGFGSELRKQRFLLSCEMYFHALQGTRKPTLWQYATYPSW